MLEFSYVSISLFKWLQLKELKNEILWIPAYTQGLYVMTTSYVLDIFEHLVAEKNWSLQM